MKQNIKLHKRINRQARALVVWLMRMAGIHPLMYRSFWFYVFNRFSSGHCASNYITSRPNPLADIGHQVSNWMSGHYYAGFFNLKYAYTRFPDQEWDAFLGLGEGDPTVRNLVTKEYFSRVRLPWFNIHRKVQVDLVRRIIASYDDRKVVFELENDQPCEACPKAVSLLKQRYHAAFHRASDTLLFNADHFNVAIYLPLPGKKGGHKNMRDPLHKNIRQQIDYLNQLLPEIFRQIPAGREYRLFLFARGKESDYKAVFENVDVRYCLHSYERKTLMHLIHADLVFSPGNALVNVARMISSANHPAPAAPFPAVLF
jgi:hypothetical protein